jgi:POT family proton-dependent oligopeptide transporter
MVIGLITYRLRAQPTLGSIGLEPSVNRHEQEKVRRYTLIGAAIVAVVVALPALGVITINPVAVAARMRDVMLGLAITYFLYLFFLAGLTTDEKKRVAVIIVLFLFATIFWSAFEQAPTSLNLFAQDFTDRMLFGWEVPVLWLQAVNSLFVILFAPVFAMLWVAAERRGINISSPAKFAFGLFCAGLGFLVMVAAANKVISGAGAVKVSMMWLTVSYLLQTFGELALSPVGLSSMTKLAPRKFVGQMMGVWFMAAALGNLIAGIVGGHVDPEKLDQMPALFNRTAMSLFIATAVLGALVIPIRRMMRSSSTVSH